MTNISRRRFLVYGAGVGAALALPRATGPAIAVAPSGFELEKFIQPVPVPGAGIVVATPSGANQYSFVQRQISRQLHPELPPTPFWAYDDGSGLTGQAGSFGMAVVAHSGTPLQVSYTHNLPQNYPAWIPVDTRLTPLGNQVRVLTHLHGGFVAGSSDGNPAVTANGFGPGQTQTVYYPNQPPQQPAQLLWFHDHGLGATRLNVFAGLAAAYIIRDGFDTGTEPNPIGIPGGAYEIPLVIQDRRFNADGTFLYPTSDIGGVTWIGEYFGNVMLVNGKVWPFLNVEPRLYRFRILNGSNARILSLSLGGASLVQIGAEGGLWDLPVPVKRLVLAPAERADVLVDFSGFAGQTLVLRNSRPSSPVSTPAPSLSTVMQIRVGSKVNQPGPRTVPTTLPGRKADLPAPVKTRYITLNEVDPETAGWFLNLNAAHFGETAESPEVGTVEDWVYINLTEDTHPMHTHLFMHQVIGRTPFNVDAYRDAYGTSTGVPGGLDPTPFATGPMEPPGPGERGFKDTVKANPGYFTTIRGKFDLPTGVTTPQTYVHHCHIVEHEDNDMMQTFTVVA
ncbi:multicopper oxidase domain-containing protein [Arthrobacter silvisoli]|uniref:multicopper oxidase domain-containing protein n=1 Tax=Arthrobacter silvisoli TaxID=2291022 RepID=UPI000E2122FA|nr:multicopper oxidase domain-containing protein [Arthrobacter silvisoli]